MLIDPDDPNDPNFGEISWILVGDPSHSVLTSTVDLVSSAGIADLGFEQQHDVTALSPDSLLVWDNGLLPEAGTRAIRFNVTDKMADLVEEWPVGAYCPGQGSASLLSSGHVLVDCAPADTIAELDGNGTTFWSAQISCRSGLMLRPLYRGLPIDLFPEQPDAVP